MIETRITIGVIKETIEVETKEKKLKRPETLTLQFIQGKSKIDGLEFNIVPKETIKKKLHELLDMLIEQIEEE